MASGLRLDTSYLLTVDLELTIIEWKSGRNWEQCNCRKDPFPTTGNDTTQLFQVLSTSNSTNFDHASSLQIFQGNLATERKIEQRFFISTLLPATRWGAQLLFYCYVVRCARRWILPSAATCSKHPCGHSRSCTEGRRCPWHGHLARAPSAVSRHS